MSEKNVHEITYNNIFLLYTFLITIIFWQYFLYVLNFHSYVCIFLNIVIFSFSFYLKIKRWRKLKQLKYLKRLNFWIW